MNSANPYPANLIQTFLYSLAKGINNVFDPAPSAGTPTVGTLDQRTGIVTGWTGFAAGNGLTFTANQPGKGNITVAGDGTYTYAPTQAARQAANVSTTDNFTVTVHEGLSTNAVTVTVPVLALTQTPPVDPGNSAPPIFVGDYSTGNFSQWPGVQVKGYNSSGAKFIPNYSASIVNDPVKGKVARFEVRPGDVPPFGGGERSQVQADNNTGGTEGQTLWYQFSVKFDPSFPQNHADLGWEVTNSWHPDSNTGSGPFQWGVGMKNGAWSLTIQKQSSPGVYIQAFSIYDTPLDVGQWHDVKMEVHFSTSDSQGWIKLWMNGVPQTFINGADTYNVRTLVPGTSTVYYKEGIYREPTTSTDILYTTGFEVATDEASL
jgi:hypothetical protein